MCTNYTLTLRAHPQFYFHTMKIFSMHALHTDIAPAPKNFHCALLVLNAHTLCTNIMCVPQAQHLVMLNFSALIRTPHYEHATHSTSRNAKFQFAHSRTIIFCASLSLHYVMPNFSAHTHTPLFFMHQQLCTTQRPILVCTPTHHYFSRITIFAARNAKF
jgi:hypothetical protein